MDRLKREAHILGTCSLSDTYDYLREWYQDNARKLLDGARPGSQRATAIMKSLPAIDMLPPASELSVLEIRVAFFEITSGILSWSCWDKVENRWINELVASTLLQAGFPKILGDEDRQRFRESKGRFRSVFPSV